MNVRNEERRHERGSALLIALFLALVVSGLCTTLLLTSGSNNLVAANERDRDRALFASKAGLNYGYHLFLNGLLTPTAEGSPFDSFGEGVLSPLEGGSFAGRLFDDGDGLYRMLSTGNFRRSNCTTELVFQTAPELYNYGFIGFGEVNLHVHSPEIHDSLEINATIFSNNWVEVHAPITVNGSIVSSGSVEIADGTDPAEINGDVFAYALENGGSINGNVSFLASVTETNGAPDVTDQQGNGYVWYLDRNSPDSFVAGSGTVSGDVSRYVVQNGDAFRTSLFNEDGSLKPQPDLNVIRYLSPPKLDYAAMKAFADQDDPTYFETTYQAVQYLTTKKVTEVVDGQQLTTVKVGTPTAPEFIYVADDLPLTFNPELDKDYWGAGLVKADGLHIEGGIYTAGDFTFDGPLFFAPDQGPEGYEQLRINALPYCLPAIVSYSQPPSGTVDNWTPEDTPAMLSEDQSTIRVRSHNVGSPLRYQGPVKINGLTYAEHESHFHHMSYDVELITFNGAQLAYKIHNCDYFKFTHDPEVSCTRFLHAEAGTGSPSIISFRELR